MLFIAGKNLVSTAKLQLIRLPCSIYVHTAIELLSLHSCQLQQCFAHELMTLNRRPDAYAIIDCAISYTHSWPMPVLVIILLLLILLPLLSLLINAASGR
jgi:hypothetical protein